MSVPESIKPEENDRTELLELERALLSIVCPLGAVVAEGGGKTDTLALLVLFINFSDFLDAADEERGLPIRLNENRLVFSSFSGCISSIMVVAERGSSSSISSSAIDSGGGGESGFKEFRGTCS